MLKELLFPVIVFDTNEVHIVKAAHFCLICRSVSWTALNGIKNLFNLLMICLIHLLVNVHPHVIPNPYDYFFSVQRKRRCFTEYQC